MSKSSTIDQSLSEEAVQNVERHRNESIINEAKTALTILDKICNGSVALILNLSKPMILISKSSTGQI